MFASRLAIALGLMAAILPFETANASFWADRTEDVCDTGWVVNYLTYMVDGKFRDNDPSPPYRVELLNPTLRYERKRDDEHVVSRKFCQATVRMRDGQRRAMWYIIETPWGFSGTPKLSGVEFCIAGLDPDHIYGKDCSTIRNSLGW